MPVSLLATKFLIPPLNAHHVYRPRLTQRLDDCRHHALTLISAPAGYGKTILLADWAQRIANSPESRQPTLVAWVALDAGDNDPLRFWIYVLTALNRLLPLAGALEAVIDSLQAAAPPALETILGMAINALASGEAGAELVLVLDDFHTLTAPSIHDSLVFLLDHLPPRLHLLLASRADPPLALARLRVRGRLLELRASDLRFSLEEAAEFLNTVMQLNLAATTVAELEARIEGWIAGLQLAALSLKGRADPAAFVQGFTGQHPFVLEYFVDEVVGGQPESVRRFLEQTSILDRLCAPVCEAVTGQPNSAATLERLWHRNLFIEPLDETGQWYRRHHLFADVLLAQLQRTQPDLVPVLHRRARDWYIQNGFLHEAMRHAQTAGQFEWMAETIETEHRRLIGRGEFATLRLWLDALPPALVAARPRCLLAQAWSSVFSSRFDVLAHYLTQAEAALVGQEAAEARPLRGEILALRAVIGSVRGEVAPTLAAAEQALALVDDADRLSRALAHQALGNAYRMQGQPDQASREFKEALPLAPSIGPPATIAATLRLGQVQAMQGRLREAAQTFQQALDLGNEYGGQVALFTSEAHTRLGDIYREWGQLDVALACVLDGLDLARRTDNIIAGLTGNFTLIHIQAARGEAAQAWETWRQLETTASHYDFPHLADRVALHRAWLEMTLGDLEAAARWATAYARRREQTHGQSERVTDFDDTLLARVLIRLQRSSEALPLLAETREKAQAAGRGWTVAQTWVLDSLALQAGNRLDPALKSLERALLFAAPEGYVRLFADEGEPMRKLLSAIGGHSSARAYAKRLLNAGAPASPPTDSLVEALSSRELTVLRLMAEGASNQAIAEALVISLGTVKSHINRILGKLAVRNRTEAAARARLLRLL